MQLITQSLHAIRIGTRPPTGTACNPSAATQRSGGAPAAHWHCMHAARHAVWPTHPPPKGPWTQSRCLLACCPPLTISLRASFLCTQRQHTRQAVVRRPVLAGATEGCAVCCPSGLVVWLLLGCVSLPSAHPARVMAERCPQHWQPGTHPSLEAAHAQA
jgi:hypothetical protein